MPISDLISYIQNHLLVQQMLAPSIFLFSYSHFPPSFRAVCFMHLKYYIGDRSRELTRLPIKLMPTLCGKSLLWVLCEPRSGCIKFRDSWPPWLQQKWSDLPGDIPSPILWCCDFTNLNYLVSNLSMLAST